MLVLRNIVRSKDFIQADFFPEDGNEKGFVKISLSDGQLISSRKALGYEHSTMLAHAIYQLRRLMTLRELPRESRTIWY